MQYEYTILCSACGGHTSSGGLEAFPEWTAADILSHAKHNPGCDLSHPQRSVPVVKRRVEQNIVAVYTIQPGAYKDAEMIVE